MFHTYLRLLGSLGFMYKVSETPSVFLSFRCLEHVFYIMQSHTGGTASSVFDQLDIFSLFPLFFPLSLIQLHKTCGQVYFSLFCFGFFFKFIYIYI